MEFDLHQLDFIDILGERHLQLRKLSEKRWNENSDIYLSNSEWFILARIYKKEPRISYVTKNVDISRQATHKFIKKLEEKGLVKISNMKDNKRDKCIRLTELGIECYEKNQALKAELIEQIGETVGSEQLALVEEVLKADWGLR